jgi:diadenosine tetraphosphatase ApaH/serine/threonine PP2A family protein phosphatase
MNKIYGFEGEVRSKLSDTFVELFAEVFCCLPLAHVINGKVFVVHGGLFSTDGVKLDEIRAIDRFCEPPEEGKPIILIPFIRNNCDSPIIYSEFFSWLIKRLQLRFD